MRTPRTTRALLAAAALATAWPAAAQVDPTAVPCRFDWHSTFMTPQVTRAASDIAELCADSRKVPWDEKQSEAEREMWAVEAAPSELEGLLGEWRRMVTMVEQEKEYLKTQLKRVTAGPGATPGPAPARAGGGTTAAAAAAPVRFTTPADYQPWMSPAIKAQLKGDAGVRTRITALKGAVRLRRGDVDVPLKLEAMLPMRSGDAVATGTDGEFTIQLDDGSRLAVGTSTEVVWANGLPCAKSSTGFPQLVRGVISWVAIGDTLRDCSKAVETRNHSVASLGSSFTVRYGEANGRGVTTISALNGSVRVTDLRGTETTLALGKTQVFDSPAASSVPADDPAVKAILAGAPVLVGERWFVPMGPAGVWLNRMHWVPQPDSPDRPDRRTFESLDGEASGMLLFEPALVERGSLKAMALGAVQGSPAAKVVREEWREIGPLSVLYLEVDIPDPDGDQKLMGEYFSGAQGTVALVVLVPKEHAPMHQAEIARALSSLVSVYPFSLRGTN